MIYEDKSYGTFDILATELETKRLYDRAEWQKLCDTYPDYDDLVREVMKDGP